MEDDAEPQGERVAAGVLGALANPADGVGDGRPVGADTHEDAVGDAPAHFERARSAGGQPDWHRPVEGQIRRALGADLDLIAGQESAHQDDRVLHLGDARGDAVR